MNDPFHRRPRAAFVAALAVVAVSLALLSFAKSSHEDGSKQRDAAALAGAASLSPALQSIESNKR